MLILLLIIIIFLLSVATAAHSLAPWVPTRKKDLDRISRLAQMKPGEVFYDLGCGDGRVAMYIAKHTKAKAIGLELALPFYLISKLRQILTKNKNFKILLKNAFYEDLNKADVIYIFPTSKDILKGKIIEKFNMELGAGTRVITYAFPIEAWQHSAVSKPTPKDLPIYLYKI